MSSSADTLASAPAPPTELRPRPGGILGNYFVLARVVLDSIRTGNLARLRGSRDEAFANFYKTVGHNFAAYEATTCVPRLVARAHGVVLELGPGTGNQLPYFDAAKVEHVFGVEINEGFADPLLKKLKAVGATNGLDKKYTPVFCGIEDNKALAAADIVDGSVDCVVDMQVLCSVPDARAAARQLYRLLKPGGELLFWEHSQSNEFVARWVQWGWGFLWPVVVGGCRLDVPIKKILLEAGEWETVELEVEAPPYSIMPRVSGRLVKAKQHASA